MLHQYCYLKSGIPCNQVKISQLRDNIYQSIVLFKMQLSDNHLI